MKMSHIYFLKNNFNRQKFYCISSLISFTVSFSELFNPIYMLYKPSAASLYIYKLIKIQTIHNLLYLRENVITYKHLNYFKFTEVDIKRHIYLRKIN